MNYAQVMRGEEQESIKQIDHVICVEVAKNLILLQVRKRIYTRVNEEQTFYVLQGSYFFHRASTYHTHHPEHSSAIMRYDDDVSPLVHRDIL